MAAEGVHGTRQGDVVEIVPGGLRQRPLLAPAGDPAVDEPRIAGEAILGAETEPLGHPRAEPLDQRIGALDEAQGERLAVRMLEVERQASPPAQQQIIAQRTRDAEIASAWPIDAQHRGTQVGEQHPAHWPRPDARQFDDFDPGERSHGEPPLRCGGIVAGSMSRRRSNSA